MIFRAARKHVPVVFVAPRIHRNDALPRGMRGLLLMALFTTQLVVAAQEISVDVTLTPTELPFHHVARYQIRVEAPAAVAIRIGPWKPSTVGVEFERRDPKVRALDGGRQQILQEFLLYPYLVGPYESPPVDVLVDDVLYKTLAPQSLDVRAPTDEERAAAAISAPLRTRRPGHVEQTSVWLLGLVALLSFAAVGAFFYGRKRGSNTPLRSPWDQAAWELQDLLDRLTRRDIPGELFYRRLSDIVRDYVTQRYGIVVYERSTPELAESITTETPLSEALGDRLVVLLRAIDSVKYARREPAPSQMAREAEEVRAWVADTVPVVVENGGDAP